MKEGRVNRLNSLFREKIAQILLTDFNFPSDVIVSVTDVDTAPDLSQSRVSISVYAEEPEKADAAFESLIRAVKHIRYQLASEIEIRKIPRLYFVRDDSMAVSDRLTRLIDSL
jgi:ribosome-binding factor A